MSKPLIDLTLLAAAASDAGQLYIHAIAQQDSDAPASPDPATNVLLHLAHLLLPQIPADNACCTRARVRSGCRCKAHSQMRMTCQPARRKARASPTSPAACSAR